MVVHSKWGARAFVARMQRSEIRGRTWLHARPRITGLLPSVQATDRTVDHAVHAAGNSVLWHCAAGTGALLVASVVSGSVVSMRDAMRSKSSREISTWPKRKA